MPRPQNANSLLQDVLKEIKTRRTPCEIGAQRLEELLTPLIQGLLSDERLPLPDEMSEGKSVAEVFEDLASDIYRVDLYSFETLANITLQLACVVEPDTKLSASDKNSSSEVSGQDG